MLRQLRIQNFKIWKDTGTIHMTPITLFFGANSSGKSSIGQFLMMLKQTVESPDRKAGFYPAGKIRRFNLVPIRKWFFIAIPKIGSRLNTNGIFRTLQIKDPIRARLIQGTICV